MQFLKLKLPGAYLDAFFYRGHLYLLTEENTLQVLDWNRLIERVFPAPDRSGTDPLAAMILTNNSLAHGRMNPIYWTQYDEFKNILLKNLQEMSDTVLYPEENECNEFDLGPERFHTLELYYSHVWLLGEESVSYVKTGPGHVKGKCSKLYRVLDDCACSLGTRAKTLWVMSPDLVHVISIRDISPRRVKVEFGKEKALSVSANHIGWHWGDVVMTSDFDFQTSIWMQVSRQNVKAQNVMDADPVYTNREQILEEYFTGQEVPTEKKNSSFYEIALDIGKSQRLYCSRERAVGVSPDHSVQAFHWGYDLELEQNGLSAYTISNPNAERVLIGTFGWIIEETSGVLLIDKIKKRRLYKKEPTQVRTFPSAHWYENLVVIVGDEDIEVIAILDYDFLMPKKLQDVNIGRKSEYFLDRYRQYSTTGGGF
ncbi:MAG: hypothetical protein OXN20_12100 [Gemmatimonadota bacterium]|nr:hypothetical protein [Gemmatimonadota bacterium]